MTTMEPTVVLSARKRSSMLAICILAMVALPYLYLYSSFAIDAVGFTPWAALRAVREAPVSVPDPMLREHLLHTQGTMNTRLKPSILAERKYLNLHRVPENLEGVQHCRNLFYLAISNSQREVKAPVDLSPLVGLPRLTELQLEDVSISSTTVLATLPRLEAITLSFHWLPQEHRSLACLTDLHLKQCAIVGEALDPTALATVRGLESLSLDRAPKAAAQLEPLGELRSVTLTHMDLANLEMLRDKPHLHQVLLDDVRLGPQGSLAPLVENPGFAEGDELELWGCGSLTSDHRDQIDALRAKGVTVAIDESLHPDSSD